jgi:hypothetical protein
MAQPGKCGSASAAVRAFSLSDQSADRASAGFTELHQPKATTSLGRAKPVSTAEEKTYTAHDL